MIFSSNRAALWLFFLGFTSLNAYSSSPSQYDTVDSSFSKATTQNSSQYQQVRSILEKRCMVCHGCYDAPCQLKLTSYTGVKRGASKTKVYDGERIDAALQSRLFIDAQTTQEWRQKQFYSAIKRSPSENSVLYQLLSLKERHPQPNSGRLPDSFTLGLNREDVCPTQDEFESFAQKHPNWGMPYAMPNLPKQEYQQLLAWAKQGAPGSLEDLNQFTLSQLAQQYEAFLNGHSLKQRLMARYVYEHLFLAHLHFADTSNRTFYQLVRSKTPPGKAIDLIVSRRPYDDPGQERVYYRLRPVKWSIVDKDHLVYSVAPGVIQKYQQWFLEPKYSVDALPGYDPKESANPFKIFAQMPAEGRYRFMLDQAQFIIEGFIKGPVCRGQVALNVIEEQFWVMFFDPDEDRVSRNTEFLAEQADNLALPAEQGVETYQMLAVATKYHNKQQMYLDAKQKALRQSSKQPSAHSFNLIWDGEGQNRNALLTVFRNQDSATVMKGFHGKIPKTVWVIDYPLFERIQYLLVSGFDVYGNIGHQLNTRLYMDFLRMEGENNFLSFLPEQARNSLRDYWYRKTPEEMIKTELAPTKTSIVYQTTQPKNEFLQRFMARPSVEKILNQDLINRPASLQTAKEDKKQQFLQALANLTGEKIASWPEVSFLRIRQEGAEDEMYTLYLNNGYYNVSSLLFDEYNRVPKENKVTVVKGLQSSYPNMFFDIDSGDFDTFLALATRAKDQTLLGRWVEAYGVRRTSPQFWNFLDTLHFYQQKQEPIAWGLFDLNRYRND